MSSCFFKYAKQNCKGILKINRTYAKLFQLGITTFGAGEASQAWDARYVGRQYIV
jgi:hypothetical protein